MRGHVVSCRLTEGEFDSFKELCIRNGCTVQDMLRAVVIDALYDEGMNVRRREQEGCTSS
jgi:predicted DNA-binding ribbon-helix-helix protein